MQKTSKQRMILCGGTQSSGSTLISWCFLQRQDTDGLLDMSNDLIRYSFHRAKEPILWVKMTVGAFRWLDVYETFRDLGWDPEPLLVVRDIRAAYASLMSKDYGFNGCTAEEPPLRMRFRRFLLDWELFRVNRWPIIKYEDFIQDEYAVLIETCRKMALPWDEGMISWRKKLYDIAYVDSKPNATFSISIDKAASIKVAKLPDKGLTKINQLPKKEIEWLEEIFASYIDFHNYPKKISQTTIEETSINMITPSYQGTKRQWYYDELIRLDKENEILIRENEKLRNNKGEFE